MLIVCIPASFETRDLGESYETRSHVRLTVTIVINEKCGMVITISDTGRTPSATVLGRTWMHWKPKLLVNFYPFAEESDKQKWNKSLRTLPTFETAYIGFVINLCSLGVRFRSIYTDILVFIRSFQST